MFRLVKRRFYKLLLVLFLQYYQKVLQNLQTIAEEVYNGLTHVPVFCELMQSNNMAG